MVEAGERECGRGWACRAGGGGGAEGQRIVAGSGAVSTPAWSTAPPAEPCLSMKLGDVAWGPPGSARYLLARRPPPAAARAAPAKEEEEERDRRKERKK